MKMSINSLSQYPAYKWQSNNQKIVIDLSKLVITDLIDKTQKPKETYTIFLEIIYYNDNTKDHLKGLFIVD